MGNALADDARPLLPLADLTNHGFALGAQFRSSSVTLARIGFVIRFARELVFHIAATAARCSNASDSIFDRSFVHDNEHTRSVD